MRKNFYPIVLLSTFLVSQTNEQIKQAKKYIENSGMSKQEVINAARERGYSDKDIEKVIEVDRNNSSKNLIQNLSLSDNETSLPSNVDFENSNNNGNITDDGELEKTKTPKRSMNSYKNLPFFGYSVFEKDPSLFQSTQVGALDPNYIIGPGDEIIVMLWGETQFREVLKVDREGFVFIPEIGQVFVNGLDLDLLESKLFKVFSKSYASLSPPGQNATSFLDVSLGNMRPLRIQVLGEVEQPGAYTVSTSTTLFSSLYYFNGPKKSGSLRDIQLIRNGEKIASIDFYDYLLSGKKPNDQKLQLEDVIFIPRRLETVSISGEINRPGIYEIKPDENLNNLIEIAGSLKITAYLKRIQIDRIVPFDLRKVLNMDRMFIDINLEQMGSESDNVKIKDGDNIEIFSIMDMRENVVEIRGAVSRPGIYELVDSLRLSDLVKNADGITGDAYLDRFDIIRTRSDFKEELISLDLGLAVSQDADNDILLANLDRVFIYSYTEMVEKSYVKILGNVKTPGTYELLENMQIYDLIFKAGGLVDEGHLNTTYLARADLIRLNKNNIESTIIQFDLQELKNNKDSEMNLYLNPNDIIRIYKKNIFINNKPVTIKGSVNSPGKYLHKTDMDLKDLILESGGFSRLHPGYKVDIVRLDTSKIDTLSSLDTISFLIDQNYLKTNKNEEKVYHKIPLKPFDIIYLRETPSSIYGKEVIVKGEVLYPGNYAIISNNERITDIIDRAGGLTSMAYPDASNYVRNNKRINMSMKKIIKNPKLRSNFEVLNGDVIEIAMKPNVVEIRGELNSPGFQKFESNLRLKKYLELAGGYSPDADLDNIWIDYPDGRSQKFSKWSFLSPKVMDGSVITVGRKKEEEPFDMTEYVTDLTTLIANVAQVIAVIVLAKG